MGEGGTDVGSSAVAVVGQAVDVDGDTGGTVALVHDVLVDGGIGTRTKGLIDSGLDLVLRHGLSLGLSDSSGKAGVVLGQRVAAETGSNGDVAAELGEEGGTLGVLRALRCLVVAHLECPDIRVSYRFRPKAQRGCSGNINKRYK